MYNPFHENTASQYIFRSGVGRLHPHLPSPDKNKGRSGREKREGVPSREKSAEIMAWNIWGKRDTLTLILCLTGRGGEKVEDQPPPPLDSVSSTEWSVNLR
jgi:hypothetical protein